ncbi:hypothetical protein BDZ94DRAFT_1182175 [Collybia nuda]|uniref:Uncharacterized protein n=1 Tax=Collybia nuda TaxID=64659 RepID=A0A9P5YHH1_9AGAR|nr:hypothetical protein BDZ94DRAFT_1182175 [Collybia nuda]
MDKDASSTVIKGTIITSIGSAFLTGIFGIVAKNAHYGLLAGAAAVNSGVTAVTFFGIREYAVSPILVSSLTWPQYVRRRRELGIGNNQLELPEKVSWSDLRKHKTLDSGISGFAAGGLLRGWKSGPKAILPGALTAGAICTLLQMAYNELGVTRLKYISRLNKEDPISKIDVPSISTPIPQGGAKSFSEKVLTLVGLQPISDDEHLAKMKIKRETYLKRIAELEAQLEVERAKEDSPP